MSVNNQSSANIMAMAAPGVEVAAMKDDLRGAMRSIRKLKPKADDNFALNEISVLSSGLDELFGIIGMAGLVIGLFSILVGGFGIANIMFVSVRERTNQIGIQMSLGAKSYFILLQFLIESVLLCLLGGIIGILAVYATLEALQFFDVLGDFELQLSLGNVITGLLWSAAIGVVSGFIPAYIASRLNPVDAIRA
ncbi:MAG: FtsX-like permease family protein [Owenweeksia sp.]|nr:FtsX-like permease family protein [Owenweeksia sp.]